MVECLSDFKMPEKIVSRLLKDSLPDNVNISRDAKNAACRSASIFILQLSIAAAEKAAQNNRETLENQDIIKAVTDLGLGEYASQLVRFGAQRKRNAKRKDGTTATPKGKSSKTTSASEGQPHEFMEQMDQESYDMNAEHDEPEEISETHNESDNNDHHDAQDHQEDEDNDEEESTKN